MKNCIFSIFIILINLQAIAQTTVCHQILSYKDDVEQNGVTTLTNRQSPIIELVFRTSTQNQTVGLRYASFSVPKGATILNAYLQFTTKNDDSGLCTVSITGEAIDDSPGFINAVHNVSNRDTTTASTSWVIPPWLIIGENGVNQQSPDIKDVIQEIVNRAGYSVGNAVTLIITGTGKRQAEAYDGNPSKAAILCVTYNPIPLPIELVSFNATPVSNKNIVINWKTASEINNDYFTIERSKNAIDWEKVDNVVGAGNSSSLLSYSITDTNPYNGVSYYRLRQIDFDGDFSYSKIKSVTIKELFDDVVKCYPNPSHHQITIVGNELELKEFTIVDVLGQNVTMNVELDQINPQKKVVDISLLRKGIYYIKTKTTATKIVKK
jgi:hypothetical protein